MAAFDAPDGPLNGSGTLAVQVLTWTMRPRAFLNAGRNAFMTDRAPKTLTSNSRRIASSGRTSIGPGVRMPALLIRISRPEPPSASLEILDFLGGHRRAENDVALGGQPERDIAAEAAACAGDRNAAAGMLGCR